jgi:hypothetical protein
MNIQKVREVLNFLAAAVFFCIGMLVLNPQYITVSSSWDYIVLQLLTFMNGLGLCLVLGLLVNTLWINRVLLKDELHDKATEEGGF